jgi:hypothetical protein
MSKEIKNLIGKKSFFSSKHIIENKLEYESGIKLFDEHLNGKTAKELLSDIHIEIYPKGLLIKIVKTFSSIDYAIPFNEISSLVITDSKPNKLRIILQNNTTISFSVYETELIEVQKFIDNNIKNQLGINVNDEDNETVIINKEQKEEIDNLNQNDSTQSFRYKFTYFTLFCLSLSIVGLSFQGEVMKLFLDKNFLINGLPLIIGTLSAYMLYGLVSIIYHKLISDLSKCDFKTFYVIAIVLFLLSAIGNLMG